MQCSPNCLVCMEHTGMYALNLCHFLEEQKLAYVLDNPLRIKRSLGLHRGKSDQADAKAIAQYAWRHQDQLDKVRPLPNQLLLKVQALLSLRTRLVKYRQGLQVANSELTKTVSTSISQAVDRPTKMLTAQMDKTIKDLSEQMNELIQSDQRLHQLFELVSSVVGIGHIITLYLLVYTNGFTAFQTARQFACYIGIVPFDFDSGTSVSLPPRVSPIANIRLKALLSNAAITAIQYDPQIRAFYQRQLDRGKDKGWIYNAVKNKLVHRVFKVVKRQSPYVKLEQ